jgi:MoaA/NifB/PqqE/SkfB family radical SAM enzyme
MNPSLEALKLKIKYNKDMKLCKRAWIFIGTFCNIKCRFCYYKNDLTKIIDFENIKFQIDMAKRLKMASVDISGGEPTIYPNYFEILEYSTKLFGSVSILSNGVKLSNEDFLKKSIDFGLNEVLFSLHGTEYVHNTVVNSKTFGKILKAIELCKKHNLIIRINHTLTTESINDIENYIKLINDIKPLQLNFIPENNWCDNNQFVERNKNIYKLNNYLDLIDNHIEVNIRYVPYCLINEKYHKNVKTLYGHIFDLRDWSIFYSYYRYNNFKDLPDEHLIDDKFIYYRSIERIIDKRINTYKRETKCYSCPYYLECDGFHKNSDEVGY